MAPERGTSPGADARNGELVRQNWPTPDLRRLLTPPIASVARRTSGGGSINPPEVVRGEMRMLAWRLNFSSPHASIRLRWPFSGCGRFSQAKRRAPWRSLEASGSNCVSPQPILKLALEITRTPLLGPQRNNATSWRACPAVCRSPCNPIATDASGSSMSREDYSGSVNRKRDMLVKKAPALRQAGEALRAISGAMPLRTFASSAAEKVDPRSLARMGHRFLTSNSRIRPKFAIYSPRRSGPARVLS